MTDPIYVLRGGLSAGIYRSWPDAVNAGWFQKQPFGNAVKCESLEQAEAYLAVEAFAEGVAGNVKSWISRQHFIVQFTIFSVSSTITAWVLLEALQWYEGYLECALDIQRKLGPMCMNLGQLQLYVAANVNALITFAFYEFTVAITVLFAWLSGLLG